MNNAKVATHKKRSKGIDAFIFAEKHRADSSNPMVCIRVHDYSCEDHMVANIYLNLAEALHLADQIAVATGYPAGENLDLALSRARNVFKQALAETESK